MKTLRHAFRRKSSCFNLKRGFSSVSQLSFILAIVSAITVGATSAWAHENRPRANASTSDSDRSNATSSTAAKVSKGGVAPSAGLEALTDFLKSIPSSAVPPSEVRSQFNKLLSSARDEHDKAQRTERDAFALQSKAGRDQKLKELADARTTYSAATHSPAERKEFTANQEQARKKVFAEAEASQAVFNSTARESQKHFDDKVKSARQEFESAYQAYVKSFYERKKNEEVNQKVEATNQKIEATKLEKGISDKQTPEERAMIQEFENIKKTPAIPLEPNDTN